MPFDENLIEEVRGLLSTTDGARELNADEEAEVIQGVRDRFVIDEDVRWWWTSVKPESVTLHYGDANGLDSLRRLLPSGEVVRLAITDDHFAPWPVIEGDVPSLLGLLGELSFFEFFVTSRTCDWVIFDTHHNDLVVAGALLEPARSLIDSLPHGGHSG